jgi:hypothetical protein
MKYKNNLVFFLLGFGFIFFDACNQKKDVISPTLFDKQKDNAIWCYYESNFMKKQVVFLKERTNRVIDTNICLIDGLVVDTTMYGDTIEFTINAFMNDSDICLPYKGMALNIFGFYPDIDTVCYRGNWDTAGRNRKVNIDTLIESWMNIKAMAEQKVLFKEFVITNESKLNDWIKTEAKKRGYIN